MHVLPRFRPRAKSIDPMTNMPRITLLPVGSPDRRALDHLARDLSGMGFDVELTGRRALPQGAFDAKRGQFQADALLGLALSVRAERVLAVTDVDLYAGDLNFVGRQMEFTFVGTEDDSGRCQSLC